MSVQQKIAIFVHNIAICMFHISLLVSFDTKTRYLLHFHFLKLSPLANSKTENIFVFIGSRHWTADVSVEDCAVPVISCGV
jgi:hypothetical protein